MRLVTHLTPQRNIIKPLTFTGTKSALSGSDLVPPDYGVPLTSPLSRTSLARRGKVPAAAAARALRDPDRVG